MSQGRNEPKSTKVNAKTQRQIQETAYVNQILSQKKTSSAQDQEVKKKIELVKTVTNWPEEEVLRVLENHAFNTDFAIASILDGREELFEWKEVKTKKDKAENKTQKYKNRGPKPHKSDFRANGEGKADGERRQNKPRRQGGAYTPRRPQKDSEGGRVEEQSTTEQPRGKSSEESGISPSSTTQSSSTPSGSGELDSNVSTKVAAPPAGPRNIPSERKGPVPAAHHGGAPSAVQQPGGPQPTKQGVAPQAPSAAAPQQQTSAPAVAGRLPSGAAAPSSAPQRPPQPTAAPPQQPSQQPPSSSSIPPTTSTPSSSTPSTTTTATTSTPSNTTTKQPSAPQPSQKLPEPSSHSVSHPSTHSPTTYPRTAGYHPPMKSWKPKETSQKPSSQMETKPSPSSSLPPSSTSAPVSAPPPSSSSKPPLSTQSPVQLPPNSLLAVDSSFQVQFGSTTVNSPAESYKPLGAPQQGKPSASDSFGAHERSHAHAHPHPHPHSHQAPQAKEIHPPHSEQDPAAGHHQMHPYSYVPPGGPFMPFATYMPYDMEAPEGNPLRSVVYPTEGSGFPQNFPKRPPMEGKGYPNPSAPSAEEYNQKFGPEGSQPQQPGQGSSPAPAQHSQPYTPYSLNPYYHIAPPNQFYSSPQPPLYGFPYMRFPPNFTNTSTFPSTASYSEEMPHDYKNTMFGAMPPPFYLPDANLSMAKQSGQVPPKPQSTFSPPPSAPSVSDDSEYKGQPSYQAGFYSMPGQYGQQGSQGAFPYHMVHPQFPPQTHRT